MCTRKRRAWEGVKGLFYVQENTRSGMVYPSPFQELLFIINIEGSSTRQV